MAFLNSLCARAAPACGLLALAAGCGSATATPDSGVMDAATIANTCPGASLCGPHDVFVDVPWLTTHLSDADVQLVDTRSTATYDAAHIPGAVPLNVGALRTTVEGVAGQVVDTATAQAAFRQAGLIRGAAIVVYGDSTTTTPARLVWTLEHFGHERVALLDGGFTAWVAASGATRAGSEARTPSAYVIDAVDPNRRVDTDYIVPRLSGGALNLVDARSAGEFEAGRIPGALSVDWTRNIDGGALRGTAMLDALYVTFDRNVPVVAYCQTGARASVAYLVLRALAFQDVRLGPSSGQGGMGCGIQVLLECQAVIPGITRPCSMKEGGVLVSRQLAVNNNEHGPQHLTSLPHSAGGLLYGNRGWKDVADQFPDPLHHILAVLMVRG